MDENTKGKATIGLSLSLTKARFGKFMTHEQVAVQTRDERAGQPAPAGAKTESRGLCGWRGQRWELPTGNGRAA
jgi:hypothetical protein